MTVYVLPTLFIKMSSGAIHFFIFFWEVGSNWTYLQNMIRERKEQVLKIMLVITAQCFHFVWHWRPATRECLIWAMLYCFRSKVALQLYGNKIRKIEEIPNYFPSYLGFLSWILTAQEGKQKSLYHFHLLVNIETFSCSYTSEICTLYF